MSNKLGNYVEQLIQYGLKHQLLEVLDIEVVRNALWRRLGIVLNLDGLSKVQPEVTDIYRLLSDITECADEDLPYLYQVEMFQAELMGLLMPRNSEVNKRFWTEHVIDPHKATEFFYRLSNDSTYIRMDRVSKNVSWQTQSAFGALDITINLSKPEKDPKEIELSKHAAPSVYPKCLLCVENAGFSGGINHPARHNHRIVKMALNDEDWYFQYSPYVYYNEHAIVFCGEHRDMKINRETFVRLVDFVDLIPHYFIGSNADLHTVGGSILTHDHYQAGNYEMPMMRAKTLYTYPVVSYPDVKVEVIQWPLSVLKVVSSNRDALIAYAAHVLACWIDYSDETVDLIAHTQERHNTVTPILRKVDGQYQLYLALRNNRSTPEHPEGLFHPHAQHHHIKRENIGLIEVMGLAVLPSRLVDETEAIINQLLNQRGCSTLYYDETPSIQKHISWLKELESVLIRVLNENGDAEALRAFIYEQIGIKFENVLRDAGIYKGSYDRIKIFLAHCDKGVSHEN